MSTGIELSAVADRNLAAILERHGLLDRMQKGELTCHFCGQLITWDNLGALLVTDGKLVPCCNLSECITAASEKGR
jgi:hypothetical protein